MSLVDAALVYLLGDSLLLVLRNQFFISLQAPNFNEARQLNSEGRFSETKRLFKLDASAGSETNNDVGFLDLWTESHLQSNQDRAAKSLFKRILELEPNNGWALINLARIAFQVERNYPETEKYMLKLLELDNPDYFQIYLNLGNVSNLQRNSVKVNEYFEKASFYISLVGNQMAHTK